MYSLLRRVQEITSGLKKKPHVYFAQQVFQMSAVTFFVTPSHQLRLISVAPMERSRPSLNIGVAA